jgi:hypothetical protein
MNPDTATLKEDVETGSLLEKLRAITPRRPLTPTEARFVAARQAALLLSELNVQVPGMPESVLAELPFLTVARHDRFPTSGMTTQTSDGWVVVLKGTEPKVRQRFSLAHELKHIIDDPFIRVLYPPLGGVSAEARAEAICDYFAGCLLMPKGWLVRDWCSGRQNIERLAEHYAVSRAAIRVRLTQLGLVGPTPRCLGMAEA